MLGAADMPIGCALTFWDRPASHALAKTHMAGTSPAMQLHTDRLWVLRRRLALDRLPLAMAGFAAKEQGLAHHR
jgi:hypothetical protein